MRLLRSARNDESPDGAFHFQVDESVQLDRVFEWELLGDGVNESVHEQPFGILLRESARHEVEALLLIQAFHGRFVLDRRGVVV